ncbi:MAG: PepSY domain-containing protein [Proteobacteria bacterium]|nr:PepSY domain-containing protein [Pseudomonadota bacterium]
MKPHITLAILCLVLAATPALADYDCDVPVQYWQSREAALRHAASLGWQVQRLKINDGCYEIRGRDAQGRAFKAKLDPQTLHVVKMKFRNDDGKHERERERTRSRDNPAPATINPVSSSGTARRDQIE